MRRSLLKTFQFLILVFIIFCSTVAHAQSWSLWGYPQMGKVVNVYHQGVNVNTVYDGIRTVIVTHCQPALDNSPTPAFLQGRLLASELLDRPPIAVFGEHDGTYTHVFMEFDGAPFQLPTLPNPLCEFYATRRIDGYVQPQVKEVVGEDAQSVFWSAQSFTDFLFNNYSYVFPEKIAIYLTDQVSTLQTIYYKGDNKIMMAARNYIEMGLNGNDPMYFNPPASLDMVGAAIANKLYTDKVLYKNGFKEIPSPENQIIMQGFKDILGLSVRRSIDAIPKWTIYDHQFGMSPGQTANFQDPNSVDRAEKYKKGLYVYPYTGNANVEINVGILHKWYYFLVKGSKGNKAKNIFRFKPIHADPKIAEKLATALILKTVLKDADFNSQTDIPKFRDLTLNQVRGYTETFITVMNAWHAVGVGEGFDPNAPPVTVDWRSTETIPEDFYALDDNGYKPTVTYWPIDPSYGSPVMEVLEIPAHDNFPQISTRKNEITPYADIDDEQLSPENILSLFFANNFDAGITGDDKFGDVKYTIDADAENAEYLPVNNEMDSKNAISVHTATELSLKYFSEVWSYHGLDGLGKNGVPVKSFVNEDMISPYGFIPKEGIFKYKGTSNFNTYKPDISLDRIGAEIARAIHYYKVGEIDPVNTEGLALHEAFGQIMGVVIENHYLQPNSPIWTFGEEQYGALALDLKNPKTSANPSMYLGEFYGLLKDPKQDATVIGKWFTLFAMGGDGHRDGKTSEYYYQLPGVGMVKALNIYIEAALMNGQKGDGFNEFMIKVLNIIDQSSDPEKDLLHKNAVTAFFAVNLGDPLKEAGRYPEYSQKNVELWPTTFKIKTNFQNELEWELQISESKDFVDGVTVSVPFKAGTANLEGITQALYQAQLDGGTQYWCRYRLTKFITISGEFWEAEPNNSPFMWSDPWPFETASGKSQELSPNTSSVYPWPAKFTWTVDGGHDDLAISAFEIIVAEDPLLNVYDNYLNRDDVAPEKEDGVYYWRQPLKQEQGYYYQITALGEDHTIYKSKPGKERKARGEPSTIESFSTEIPKGLTRSPKVSASPLGLYLKGGTEGLENTSYEGEKEETLDSGEKQEYFSNYKFEIAYNHNQGSPAILYNEETKDAYGNTIPIPETNYVWDVITNLKGGDLKEQDVFNWRVIPYQSIPVNGGPIVQYGTPSPWETFELAEIKLLAPVNGQAAHPESNTVPFEWEHYEKTTAYNLKIYKINSSGIQTDDANQEELIDEIFVTLGSAIKVGDKIKEAAEGAIFDNVTHYDYGWRIEAIWTDPKGVSPVQKFVSDLRYFKMNGERTTLISPGSYWDGNDLPQSIWGSQKYFILTWDDIYAPYGYVFGYFIVSKAHIEGDTDYQNNPIPLEQIYNWRLTPDGLPWDENLPWHLSNMIHWPDKNSVELNTIYFTPHGPEGYHGSPYLIVWSVAPIIKDPISGEEIPGLWAKPRIFRTHDDFPDPEDDDNNGNNGNGNNGGGNNGDGQNNNNCDDFGIVDFDIYLNANLSVKFVFGSNCEPQSPIEFCDQNKQNCNPEISSGVNYNSLDYDIGFSPKGTYTGSFVVVNPGSWIAGSEETLDAVINGTPVNIDINLGDHQAGAVLATFIFTVN